MEIKAKQFVTGSKRRALTDDGQQGMEVLTDEKEK